MKSLLKKLSKRTGYMFGIAVAAIVVGISLQFAKAWTEPSLPAPNGNVGAPITTGGDQIKSGTLSLEKPAGAWNWLRVSNGTDHIYFGGDSANRGIWSDGTRDVGIGTNGSYKLLINGSNGNVGIGTTTPGGKLDVIGRAGAQSFKVSSGFADLANDAPWYGVGYSNLTLPGAGGTAVQTAGFWGLNFQTQLGQMVLTQGGNVGIGTTDPSLAGMTRTLAIGRGAGGIYGLTQSEEPGWRMSLVTEGQRRLTVMDAGNVGIGTTVPGANLDVGVGSSQCCSAQTPNISLAQGSNVNGNMSWLQFHNAGEAEAYIRLAGGGSGLRAGQRRLEIGDNQSVTTGLTVTGNVGIGTTSPARKLDVVGGDILVNGLGIGRGGNNVVDNTAVGVSALAFNQPTGIANTAIGSQALMTNSTGGANTAVGKNALMWNSNGASNTANGYGALLNNTSGSNNTASGSQSLWLNTSGNGNTASGRESMYSNTIGTWNTAFGRASLYHNVDGQYNAAVGSSALMFNTVGAGNTAMGAGALIGNTYGVSNTAIGYYADVSTGGLTNATAIGSMAVVSASNSLVLGNNANVGIGISAPAYRLDVVGDIHGTGNVWGDSDFNLKYDINSIGSQAIEDLKKLNGVRFNWKRDGSASIGVIAQDVEKVYPELVKESKGIKSVNYDGLVAPLIEAVKAQQMQIEDLKTQIETLKNK